MPDSPKIFPEDHIPALALKWASRYVGDAVTPEDWCQKYWEAYYRIAAVDSSTAEAARAKYRR